MIKDVEVYDRGGAGLQSNRTLVQLESDGVWGLRLRQAVGRVLEAGDVEDLRC